MKKTIKTIIFTVLFMVIGFGGFLVNEGIVTFEKRDTTHSRIVIEDGEVTSRECWTEGLGYYVTVRTNQKTYIGKR